MARGRPPNAKYNSPQYLFIYQIHLITVCGLLNSRSLMSGYANNSRYFASDMAGLLRFILMSNPL